MPNTPTFTPPYTHTYTHMARTHTNTPECAHMERQTTIQTANTANSRNQNATIALCVCGKRGRKNGGGARKEWKTGAWIADDGRRLSFNKVDLALATCCCWLSFPAPEVDFSPHSFPRLSLSPRFLSPFWVFPFFLRCARMRQDQINTRSHTHTRTRLTAPTCRIGKCVKVAPFHWHSKMIFNYIFCGMQQTNRICIQFFVRCCSFLAQSQPTNCYVNHSNAHNKK